MMNFQKIGDKLTPICTSKKYFSPAILPAKQHHDIRPQINDNLFCRDGFLGAQLPLFVHQRNIAGNIAGKKAL